MLVFVFSLQRNYLIQSESIKIDKYNLCFKNNIFDVFVVMMYDV